MKIRTTLCMLLLVIIQLSAQETPVVSQISSKMKQQEMSWNKGDIEGFMKCYWQSDSLTFIGKNGIQNGWKKTLANYNKSYPDKASMGKLTFTNRSIEKIDSNTYLVLGRWELKRENNFKDVNGIYSLIWQIKGKDWVIISDHSS
ncbi:MAG: nuclear transport factor 2 family protein [Bacteroidota bacterium]|nr:nuclear transport factor 2 family protein [Bacteroidota bacterium]